MYYEWIYFQVLLDASLTAAVWVYGVICFVCAICAALLPIETKGRVLPVCIYIISITRITENLIMFQECYSHGLRNKGNTLILISILTGNRYYTHVSC